MNAPNATSTRPYLIRALYEWCTDNGFTPYVAVSVDNTVQVPREYVKDNEIVLNIGFDATSSLTLGNEFIEFKARFGGAAREILVPISHVIAIYARENGQGMAFPLETMPAGSGDSRASQPAAPVQEALPAGQSSSETPDSKIMQLVENVPDTHATGKVRHKKTDAPEPPRPPTRPRPSLKRVK
ncbi:ClpXP protease specificity-enhancing factor [Polaromonas sp.]|uniref:ClpXP protease specificity-enhancing factor n=1 Tax=Polaromonas sp. TaxID=1869339 RepID=UPI0013B7B724|nr:ClpXP protease specificity-enhancing factor [Polaromonas sp.]NDP62624.1 ClpXP protease specificity-enhancing factor [Polaromonas sp.]